MKKDILKNIFCLILSAVFICITAGPLSAGGLRVIVLPWKVNSAENLDYIKDALPEMLSSRLGSGAGVEVVGMDEVKAVTSSLTIDGKAVTDKGAIEAGLRLKADYVVYGSLTVIGSAISLDGQIISPATGDVSRFSAKGTGLDSIMPMVEGLGKDLLSKALTSKAPASEVKAGPDATPSGKQSTVIIPAPSPVATKDKADEAFIVKPRDEASTAVLWRSAPMEGAYSGFVAEDLDADGTKELFLLSSNRLVVAKRLASGLETLKELPITGGISISSVDSDSDGSKEVYVSSIRDGKAYTAIVEFKDGAYAVTTVIDRWLVRSAHPDPTGAVLIGQRFRQGDGLYGAITVLKKEGSALVEKGAFETGLPRRLSIYGFEEFDLTGSGSKELVALDDRGHVRLYRKSGAKWDEAYKSKEYFGGTLTYIEVNDSSQTVKPVPVESRAFFLDTDRDGRVELLIRRNVAGGLGRISERPMSFTSGAIVSLEWDKVGEELAENWRTRELKGYVSAFVIDDLDRDGASEITILIVEGSEGISSALKSYLLSYRLSI